ncbi:MAG: hypothetical protein GXC72_00930 [Chitinophagaceae bacterium]|nr:hypothetical protein [Chitinophagaceae bacterium]
MITLPNGCYCTELKVTPTNWKKASASTKRDWYIWYRFYDPSVRNDKGRISPKLVMVKGMNEFKTPTDRKAATEELINMEMKRLQIDGFNPITKQYCIDAYNTPVVDPNTPLITAMEMALKNMSVPKTTAANVKSCLKYVTVAIRKMRWDYLVLKDVSRKHIKAILDACNLSEVSYNHYRAYLMMLFKQIDYHEVNPASGVAKKALPKKIRPIMVKELRQKVEHHYTETAPDPAYLRFLHIFFHSGAREIELLRMQKDHVDLPGRSFIVTIKKGGSSRQVYRPIKDAVYDEWVSLYNEARPGEYLFGIDFTPAKEPCKRDYLTRKWHDEVKADNKDGGLGIKVDLYTLKHANLDETAELLSLQEASKMAGHTTPVITMDHYALGEKARQEERLRKVNNPFS